MAGIFAGSAPANDDTELVPLAEPRRKYTILFAPERAKKFAPGLDAHLTELACALVEAKEKLTNGREVEAERKTDNTSEVKTKKRTVND